MVKRPDKGDDDGDGFGFESGDPSEEVQLESQAAGAVETSGDGGSNPPSQEPQRGENPVESRTRPDAQPGSSPSNSAVERTARSSDRVSSVLEHPVSDSTKAFQLDGEGTRTELYGRDESVGRFEVLTEEVRSAVLSKYQLTNVRKAELQDALIQVILQGVDPEDVADQIVRERGFNPEEIPTNG